jgi:phage N-6-adenine-methyltransferase
VRIDTTLGVYVELDAQVDQAEDDGIMARWRFGRQLLTERKGKQLPAGRLDEVAEAIGKSRQEIGFRMTFADRFTTEDEVSNAVRNFRSWHDIVNRVLASTAHLSAEKDEWETPDDLFEELDAEFHFTIDICASTENAKCRRFYSIEDDALSKHWRGVCWMNPPYSGIDVWMEKAYAEARRGATVVCLVPSRTDVGWFWDFARHGEIRLLRGRLSFVDDEGNTGPAPFPSCLVVFGRRARVMWYERP